jgi:hypothetical protein
MFAPITKVNEGESNTPCPSTLEKLSKALIEHVILLEADRRVKNIVPM